MVVLKVKLAALAGAARAGAAGAALPPGLELPEVHLLAYRGAGFTL
jgi:hypothetical protein